MKSIVFIIVFSLFFFNASAQNLEGFGKEKPLTLSGGVSANQIAYLTTNEVKSRSPYSYFVSGNLNVNIYGWNTPLSFSYSNQSKGSFQQPYNQFSFNPTYKWVAAHIGSSNMSFSSYTLSGQTFNGFGADLTPSGPVKFSFMYGRLQKETLPDTLANSTLVPTYERMGYGLKTSYSKGKNNIDFIFFKAKDTFNPIILANPKHKVTPQENLALSLNVGKTILEKLTLNTEFNLSLLTKNLTTDSVGNEKLSNLGAFMRINGSTSAYTGYKVGFGYAAKKYTLGINYEQVAPEYKTLGGNFFANDFENITINFATRILNEKVSLSSNFGIQKDDLNGNKQSATKRFVGSVNATIQATKKININSSYSNFQTFVNIKRNLNQIEKEQNLNRTDTLNYTQMSKNINLSGTYNIKQSKEKNESLNVSLAYMTSGDQKEGHSATTTGEFYNLNSAYNLNLIKKDLSFVVSLSANHNQMNDSSTSAIGPNLSVNKAFLAKKLKSTFSVSMNNNYTNQSLIGKTINFRINNSYVFFKKHNLSLSLVVLNRLSQSSNGVDSKITDFTSTMGYNYSF